MKYIFIIYLSVLSVVDIKSRRLPAMWVYGGVAGMGIYGLLQLAQGKRTLGEWMCALLPGIICYLLARFLKVMGEGDAWIIMEIGLGFSLRSTMRIVMLSFFLSALGSVIIVILRRNAKNRRVPFVPYLFLASAFVVLG